MRNLTRRNRGFQFAQIAVAMVCCATWTLVVADDLPQEEPNRTWRTGPIRHILTAEEDSNYKHLEDDEKRAGFIRDFWARRDPTPDTPENELRVSFWKRVEEADAWFREGNHAGWETDRGRILLTAGYPDVRCGEGGPVEGWLYKRPFPSRMGIKSRSVKVLVTFTAAFTRTGSDRYKARSYRDLSDGESLLEALAALEPVEAARYVVSGASMPPSHSGHENPNHLVNDWITEEFLSPGS